MFVTIVTMSVCKNIFIECMVFGSFLLLVSIYVTGLTDKLLSDAVPMTSAKCSEPTTRHLAPRRSRSPEEGGDIC